MRLRSAPDTAPDEVAAPRGRRAPAVVIGAGRVALGIAFTVDPIQSVRFLGVDTATARRLSWLARMAAARDIALGVGTVASTLSDRGSGTWLLAGAACDIADGAALASALSRKQVSPVAAGFVIVGAFAAGAIAVATVVRRPRSYFEQ
jgi:hypothetical protein